MSHANKTSTSSVYRSHPKSRHRFRIDSSRSDLDESDESDESRESGQSGQSGQSDESCESCESAGSGEFDESAECDESNESSRASCVSGVSVVSGVSCFSGVSGISGVSAVSEVSRRASRGPSGVKSRYRDFADDCSACSVDYSAYSVSRASSPARSKRHASDIAPAFDAPTKNDTQLIEFLALHGISTKRRTVYYEKSNELMNLPPNLFGDMWERMKLRDPKLSFANFLRNCGITSNEQIVFVLNGQEFEKLDGNLKDLWRVHLLQTQNGSRPSSERENQRSELL